MKTDVQPRAVTTVYLSDLRREVFRGSVPVLLVFLHQELEYKEQLEAVENIARRYGAALKVCLAAQEDLETIGEANHTTGTPAFLFFRQGKEKGRLLGQADEAGLLVFIDRSLGE